MASRGDQAAINRAELIHEQAKTIPKEQVFALIYQCTGAIQMMAEAYTQDYCDHADAGLEIEHGPGLARCAVDMTQFITASADTILTALREQWPDESHLAREDCPEASVQVGLLHQLAELLADTT